MCALSISKQTDTTHSSDAFPCEYKYINNILFINMYDEYTIYFSILRTRVNRSPTCSVWFRQWYISTNLMFFFFFYIYKCLPCEDTLAGNRGHLFITMKKSLFDISEERVYWRNRFDLDRSVTHFALGVLPASRDLYLFIWCEQQTFRTPEYTRMGQRRPEIFAKCTHTHKSRVRQTETINKFSVYHNDEDDDDTGEMSLKIYWFTYMMYVCLKIR